MIALDQMFAALIAECHQVNVILDPRDSGVEVPDQFKQLPQLQLVYGWNLPIKIPDLRWDADALTATLSFGGVPFPTRVPWSAVVAMQGDETCLVALSRPVKATNVVIQEPKKRGALKLVD